MTVASQVKQTLSGLKNAQATLKIYSLQSQTGEAKKIFEEAYGITGEIMSEIENRLKILEYEEPQYKGV